jgi:cell division protein FtsZ
MVMPGLINLDFADIRTVMSEMGKAMMGTGEAEGDRRAIEAAEAAISNPLLDDVSMKGARGVLINITGGLDMTLFEVDAAATRIREEVDPNANIIFGSTFDGTLEGKMRVSVVATGIESPAERAASAAAPAVIAAEHRPAEPQRESAPVFRFQAQGAGQQRPASAQATTSGNPFARATAAATTAQQRRGAEASPALHLRAASQQQPAPSRSAEAVAAAYRTPHGATPAGLAEAPAAPFAHAGSGGTATALTRPRPAAVAERGANLFERVKELAFARAASAERGGGPAERGASPVPDEAEFDVAPPRHEEARPAPSAQDELGDIPAFLRRERVTT